MIYLRLCQHKFFWTVFVLMSSLYADSKHETEVFGKWLAWQQIYYDRNIAALKNELNDTFLKNFKNQYEKNLVNLKPLATLLSAISENQIQKDSFHLHPPMTMGMQSNLGLLYEKLEHNVETFVTYLVENGMASSEINDFEQKNHYDQTIEKYKAFNRLLFAQDDLYKENEYLIALANRLFEYCYDSKTFAHYQTLLTTYKHYPVARYLNASIWHILVGDGWKHWHDHTLQALKAHAQNGSEIVYIAGGTDFYHLLREGIYNITIIDPFLPTQSRFYSEGWEFLISENSLDSEIRFGPACKSIKMKCVDCKIGEPFYAKLSNGNVLTMKKNVITWHVFDRDGQQIGHVIINRRPVVQDDFVVHENKSFIMSYDEMIFIALPDMLNGWGIDPTKLSDALQINIKQLRKSVDRNILCNIRIGSMINLTDLRFINLASDPT